MLHPIPPNQLWGLHIFISCHYNHPTAEWKHYLHCLKQNTQIPHCHVSTALPASKNCSLSPPSFFTSMLQSLPAGNYHPMHQAYLALDLTTAGSTFIRLIHTTSPSHPLPQIHTCKHCTAFLIVLPIVNSMRSPLQYTQFFLSPLHLPSGNSIHSFPPFSQFSSIPSLAPQPIRLLSWIPQFPQKWIHRQAATQWIHPIPSSVALNLPIGNPPLQLAAV